MGILAMIQHFMHEILIGSSQYFTSYCIESRHLCEILKSERLGWAVKGKNSLFVELRVTYLGKCTLRDKKVLYHFASILFSRY
jgi:hypothetical protein